MQRDEENRGRGPSKHVCSSLARRRCRGRRRPATQGRPLAALTLGFVLVGAAAVSGSANNPPPPPPASLANGRQEDRWASWAPPPPGPPPSDPAVPGSGGRAAGGGGDAAAAAGGGGMGGGMGGVWGAESPDYSQGAGQGAAQEDDSCDSLMGGRSSVQPGMMGQDMASQGDARGMGHGGFGPPGMGATGGESAGHFRDTEQVAAGETQQQMQERMIREGRGSHVQHQQQQYRRQQQYQPPRPPPSWSSNAPQDSTPHQQRDQLYDESSGPVNGNGHPARPVPDLHANSMLQQQRSGTGIMGGAGEGAAGGAAGGRWEPPSAARAGAVTPEVGRVVGRKGPGSAVVKLSQYRQGGAGAADGRADVAGGSMQEGDMSRALLSNTDKEVIFDGLKKLYRKKILPLEESSRYAHFHSPPMNPADFEAKPMVLIVGQYSVGKTSFIRSLLKRDFPGQRVGPEPTTDRFVAVTHGEDERVMPGHALAMQADKPFRSLQQFGNNFLTKFEGSVVDAAILRNITLVDTPGVLSGEKQRIGRDYDFASVISWFAERADLIVVMFDAHKLDISDELKMVIDTLKPHHDKMRVLLNKADTIDTQQLMRVYGALMWSLGKVMQTPEVCRVYIGSFWEAPLSNSENRFLLDKEKNDLLEELMLLPENAVVRRINELVKRARSVKVHAYIIHYLRKQMPYVMGKQDKQEKLIRRLDQEFLACARRYGLPLGDFPKVEKFRRSLREIKDISKFKSLDKSLVHEMDKVFSSDIPKLMEKAARPGNR